MDTCVSGDHSLPAMVQLKSCRCAYLIDTLYGIIKPLLLLLYNYHYIISFVLNLYDCFYCRLPISTLNKCEHVLEKQLGFTKVNVK